MDPPRQVARHHNGSGPVFRSFKKLTSSLKAISQRPPRPLDSEIITAQSARCSNARIPTLRESQRGTSSSSMISYYPHVEKVDLGDCNVAIDNSESKLGIGTPQRKHPISVEVKKDLHAKGIMIANPVCDDSKDGKRCDESGNQVKKITLNTSQRVKLKQRQSHSDKIALPEQSENPALDELWRSTAEDWEPVKDTDMSFLKSVEIENLPGCLQFIEEYYEILKSKAHEGYLELKEKASAKTLGSGIIFASRCLPPASLLHQGRAAVKYHVEPNELLSVACRSGGADDRVRREIQNLYLENDRIRSEISHCDRRARHSIRLSSTSEDNCWVSSSNTVQRPLNDLETDSIWESVGGESSAAPSKEDLDPQSLSSRHHRPPSAVGVFESRAMLRAVQSADSLISGRMKRLLTDKDSDLLNALVEGALTVKLGTRESKDPSVTATDLSPRKSKSKSSHVNVPLKGHSKEGGGNIKIANVKPLHFLGKRGRRYTDVWNEEDFIHKTKQHHLFRVIDDWPTLISPHSDDHDGAYRDWSIHQSALLVNKIKKGFRNFEASDFGFEYVSPPVPVSTVHPACWGPNARTTASNVLSRTRKKAGDDGRIDHKSCYEIVHPAALCRNLVEPPGHYLEREEFEDIDDISMHAEVLVKEMLALEACNYIRLQSLKGYVAVSSQIDSVRSKRTRVQAALAQLYLSDVSVQQTSRRTTYSLTPDPLGARSEAEQSSLVLAAAHAPFAGDDPEPHPHRSATRSASLVHTAVEQQENVAEAANTRTRTSLLPLPRHQLGALRLQDVCHGEFLSNCAQGDLIEIFSDGSWRAGCIQNFRFDGHLLRHIKVRHLGSCAGDHVWAAVEDGRLAPPGTHIDNAQFRWLLVSRVPSFLLPDPLDIASMKNADSKSSPRLIAQCASRTNQGLQLNVKKGDMIGAGHRTGITPSRKLVKLDDGERIISEVNCHGRLDTDTSCYESNTSTGKRSSSGSSSSSSSRSSDTPPTYPGDEIVMCVKSPSQIISDTLSGIPVSAAVEVGELLVKSNQSSATSRPLPPPLPPCHGVPNGSCMGLDAVQSRIHLNNSVPSSTVLQAATHIPEVDGTEPCDALKPLTNFPFPSVSLTHRARARSEGELGTLRGPDYNQTRFIPFPPINPRPVAAWIHDSAPKLAPLPIAVPTLVSDTEISTVSPNILSETSCCENDLPSVGAEEYVQSKEQKAMLSANLVSNGPMIRTVSVLAKNTGVGLDPYRTSSGRVTATSSHVQQQHQRDGDDEIMWRDNTIGDDISVVEQSRKSASDFEGPCWQKKVHTDRRYSASETSDSAIESQPFKDQRIHKRERDVSQSPTNLNHRVDDTGRRRNRHCNDGDDSRSRSRSRSSGYHEEHEIRRKEREWIRDRDSRNNEDRSWDRCRSRSRGRSRSRSHRDSGDRRGRGSDHGRNERNDGRRNFSRSRSPSEDAAPNRSWREETLEHNCPLPARDYGQSRFMDMHRVGREKRENRSIEGRARDYDREYTSTSTSVFSVQPSMQRSYSHVQSTFQNCQPMAPQMRPTYHATVPPGSRAPGLILSVSSIPNPHYHKNYSNSVPAAPAPQPLQVSWKVSEEGLEGVAGTGPAAPPFPQLNPQPVHTEQKKNLPSFQSLYG